MAPLISIIIRSKNEERWINPCLNAVFNQTLKDFEVILVDNNSTDHTVLKAKQFAIKLVTIEDYYPGKAINKGIQASSGKYIAILSAHCIPTSTTWLETLVKNLEEDTLHEIAGVYGRQEPLTYTHDLDKRDLVITFGLDRRIQIKDTFFHNANSLIRRDVLEAVPFDDKATNIEDRIWGKEVISRGYKIIYEPEASVYHHHGIHQSGDPRRARDTVKILESLEDRDLNLDNVNHLRLNITAIITAIGEPVMFNNRPLIEYTIKCAQKSKLLTNIVVSTDNQKTQKLAEDLGVALTVLCPTELSQDTLGVEAQLKDSLEQMEKSGMFPDVIVYLSTKQPFRPLFLIDEMLRLFLTEGFDSVLPVYTSFNSCWISKEHELNRIDAGYSAGIKQPIHIGYSGLACVTFAEFIRKGQLLGNKIGIPEILDFCSIIELKNPASFVLAEKIYPHWWAGQKEAQTHI